MISKSEHPWQNFLYARRIALEWFKKEFPNYTNEDIAKTFSMDEMQVRLILMTEVKK